jgi:ferritin-like metal-binding protein YciE
MKINDPKELFVLLLNDLWQGAERASRFFQELVPLVQEPEFKEALEARVFLSGKITETLTQCFKLIGEEPVNLTSNELEMFVKDFREELGEIESPGVMQLFILVKANHLLHHRIGEYTALIAAADATGHYGVGALLESCLADETYFAERARRLIQIRREIKKVAA